jgi:heme/copper-type cytochrome/quinol oxidase subunit 2
MNFPPPEKRVSYQNHRKQAWLQIFIPILITIALGLTLAFVIGSTALNEGGDSERWAAISTIWLVIPVLVFSLIVFALLIFGIYLMMRLLKLSPPYSAKAQYLVNRATQYTQHYSDLAVKPVLFLEGVIASIKTFFRRN